jgi:hypothetical protein
MSQINLNPMQQKAVPLSAILHLHLRAWDNIVKNLEILISSNTDYLEVYDISEYVPPVLEDCCRLTRRLNEWALKYKESHDIKIRVRIARYHYTSNYIEDEPTVECIINWTTL